MHIGDVWGYRQNYGVPVPKLNSLGRANTETAKKSTETSFLASAHSFYVMQTVVQNVVNTLRDRSPWGKWFKGQDLVQ